MKVNLGPITESMHENKTLLVVVDGEPIGHAVVEKVISEHLKEATMDTHRLTLLFVSGAKKADSSMALVSDDKP